MRTVHYVNPELLGIFGLSWQEKVASFMSKRLKGTALQKKLKSFWGAGGLNTRLVNNLSREYIALQAQGQQPATFSVPPNSDGSGGDYSGTTVQLASRIAARTNVDASIILEFFRALFVLAKDGKIPYQKWNPSGYKQSTTLQKSFKTEASLGDVAKSTLTKISIIAALGLGVYIYHEFKKG